MKNQASVQTKKKPDKIKKAKAGNSKSSGKSAAKKPAFKMPAANKGSGPKKPKTAKKLRKKLRIPV